ncbi:tRNA 2'-phosphotransferase 1-like [Limulus polyphemus]|uniref:2'-phosphotransferase n=1 Tax=Limulus polyphemus TaxID=6850 RepID=A0ABM1B876_LIMPO|nr:tRNA 2'-phosphotransferase 1-like [Limulus polyphemus]
MSRARYTHGYPRAKKRNEDKDIRLSKSLSWLLRHGAEKEGLKLEYGGFASVDKLLSFPQFSSITVEDVKRVVEYNDKKRFALRYHPETGELQIRANQGHSVKVDEEGLVVPLKAEDCPNMIVHGTYFKNWPKIKVDGLSRMKRNHIHFAVGMPGENGVISGMRTNCEIFILIDVVKAIDDGFKFFQSENNVILSPGDKNGYLKPKYFKEVWQFSPRILLL